MSSDYIRTLWTALGLKAYFHGDWKILWMPPPFASGEHSEKVEEMVALWEQYKEDNTVLDISLDLADRVK